MKWRTILLAALVTGCATPAPVIEPALEPEAVPESDEASTGEPDASQANPVDLIAPPAPRPPTPPPASILVNLTPAEVQAMLGDPTHVRREDHVQVMQYRNESCVLDLVFYEPTAREHFRLNYMEARDLEGETQSQDDCFATLLPEARWEELS